MLAPEPQPEQQSKLEQQPEPEPEPEPEGKPGPEELEHQPEPEPEGKPEPEDKPEKPPPATEAQDARQARLAQMGGAEPTFRQIRAVFDADTIRVYQAYNDKIADAAVAANSFSAPLEAGLWSSDRMTWIKPSAVWMAYRCGWTTVSSRPRPRLLSAAARLRPARRLR